MRNIIITIVFILLVLTAIASAYAQEEWFEVAESSGVSYEDVIRYSAKTAKKEVEIDETILTTIESLTPRSQFAVRNFAKGGCAPSGARDWIQPGRGDFDSEDGNAKTYPRR
jgi:hypothetical protein